MKTIGLILKWILILLVLLLSVATFMGHSYGQTLLLLLFATALAWWPGYFQKKWSKRSSGIFRGMLLVTLLAAIINSFNSGPKTSIYLSDQHHRELLEFYAQKMADWPSGTEDLFIPTKYGQVHVLACGSPENPPLLMIHAASMGAHSWAENLPPLLDRYRIYAIDNIGEGNKSTLSNAAVFPQDGAAIARLHAVIADSLGVANAPVFGASNGGFIALSYAYHYPERVDALLLFGPMGLTPLSNHSILMLSIATMYPFQFVRDDVAKWAFGTDAYVHKKYGDWFNCIMEGTIPSVARPVPLTTAQKQKMSMPVLLFLGTQDPIVGDAALARQAARDFPNIQIEVLESGHMVAVEHATHVNSRVRQFLQKISR